jgi:hypothetical protein
MAPLLTPYMLCHPASIIQISLPSSPNQHGLLRTARGQRIRG